MSPQCVWNNSGLASSVGDTIAASIRVPPSTDATLSALALEDAAADSSISLSPRVASGTASYTANAAGSVPEQEACSVNHTRALPVAVSYRCQASVMAVRALTDPAPMPTQSHVLAGCLQPNVRSHSPAHGDSHVRAPLFSRARFP